MNFIARPADPSFEAVAAAVMLVLATCANAEKESWTVPAEMCRGFWFVPISLSEEKYGADNTLYFIYDTGASTTYVDRSALVMSPVLPAQLP